MFLVEKKHFITYRLVKFHDSKTMQGRTFTDYNPETLRNMAKTDIYV